MKTMDLILLILGIFLLAFVITVLVIFAKTGCEPATLIACVFSICGCECGIMGWIKTAKEKIKKSKDGEEQNHG